MAGAAFGDPSIDECRDVDGNDRDDDSGFGKILWNYRDTGDCLMLPSLVRRSNDNLRLHRYLSRHSCNHCRQLDNGIYLGGSFQCVSSSFVN